MSQKYQSPEYEMFYDDSRYECKVKLLSFVDDSFCGTVIDCPQLDLTALKRYHFMTTDRDLQDFKNWIENSCNGYITAAAWKKFFETRGYKVGGESLLQEFQCGAAWWDI